VYTNLKIRNTLCVNYSTTISDECPDDWNQELTKNKTGNIYNTAEYAQYANNWLDWSPLYFRIIDKKGIILLQVIMYHYSPKSKKFPKLFRPLIKKLKSSIRWQYGPMTNSFNSLPYFLDYLKNQKKSFYGILHPLLETNSINFQKTKWSTFLIDLSKSENELYDNMDKNSAQKNISRAIKRGVKLEIISKKNLNDYYDLVKNSRISLGLDYGTFEEMSDMWDLLERVGYSGFIAKLDDIPVGGLGFSFFNNYINEWGVARSQLDYDKKLYSQDLIKWEIMKWGVKNKMNWYDLSGVNLNPSNKKEEGILRYKKKWGGLQKDYWILSR